jgi:outer membrane protein OmpA-like peptidoglycan-associated protein
MWHLLLCALALAFAVANAGAQGSPDDPPDTGDVPTMDSVLPDNPATIQGSTIDLSLPVLDLNFPVQNLAAETQPLQIRETATETRIELPADILFDFDKADIRPSAEPALMQAADLLRARARGTVRIEGHTDAKGSAAYNKRLADRRARAVQTWLTTRGGVGAVRFQIQAFGADRPVAANTKPDGSDNPEGRQQNRRVEIVFARR